MYSHYTSKNGNMYRNEVNNTINVQNYMLCNCMIELELSLRQTLCNQFLEIKIRSNWTLTPLPSGGISERYKIEFKLELICKLTLSCQFPVETNKPRMRLTLLPSGGIAERRKNDEFKKMTVE